MSYTSVMLKNAVSNEVIKKKLSNILMRIYPTTLLWILEFYQSFKKFGHNWAFKKFINISGNFNEVNFKKKILKGEY